jgi:hypothetical protein
VNSKTSSSSRNLTLGYACNTSANCASSLICDSDVFICLFNYGGSCISDDDCVNFLKCTSYGTCGCPVNIIIIRIYYT